MLNDLLSEDGSFKYSGEPSRIEYYKCFHDPSSSEMITGEELIELEKGAYWSEEHRQIWLYFYRPYNYGDNIGRKQREEKRIKESTIEENQASILSGKIFKFISLAFIITTLIFSVIYNSFWLIVIPTLAYIYFYFEDISLHSAIENHQNVVKILDKEIAYLLEQKEEIHKSRLSASDIETLFWKDINYLEGRYVNKASHEDSKSIRANVPDFYKNVKYSFIENRQFPTFPVIPSWALLQSSHRSNRNRGNQVTGVKIAAEDIGKKVATWRGVRGKHPIFRLWYIQFLFFHEKNLSLMSFYYDFITKKHYSEHIESYQYNHITNYSYTDEDITYMRDDPLIQEIKLPENLSKNIFGNQVKTISLESASGAFYRCVLPDRDVTNGLNEWIQYQSLEEALNEESESELSVEMKKELFKNIEYYDSLIENLAWLSFKQLREKVARFALLESSN